MVGPGWRRSIDTCTHCGGDVGGGLVLVNGCGDIGYYFGMRIVDMGMRIAFTVVVMEVWW